MTDAGALRAAVEQIADQLCVAVDGHFDFQVHAGSEDETAAKLAILVNVVLEAARRAIAQREEAHRILEWAHRQLQENELKLVHTEKMAGLGQMAAGVAHEINNPTAFLMSNLATLAEYLGTLKALLAEQDRLAEALQAGRGEEAEAARARIAGIRREEDLGFLLGDLDRLLAECREGGRRVKEIVQALRSFAHPDHAEEVAVDLNAGLETALRMIRSQLKPGCRLRQRLEPLPPIRGYPGQMNQVFLNLLLNAAQAVDGEGEVGVEARVEEGQAVIRVSDTGRGIPKEHLPKLFTPFFTTKPVGEGTGLGLSISYGIVQRHGGTLSVESEAGKGSAFTVRLPLT